jgi:hypothetical protein
VGSLCEERGEGYKVGSHGSLDQEYSVTLCLFFAFQFCKLCDKDCPCETSPSKPNCKMCKVDSFN